MESTSPQERDAKEAIFSSYWKRYERLIQAVLRRTVVRIDEDIQQVARVALWEAVQSYNPHAGRKFSSWLWWLVRLRVLEWISVSAYPVCVPYRAVSDGSVPRYSTASLSEDSATYGIESDEETRYVPEELVYLEHGYEDVLADLDRKLLVDILRSELSDRQLHCICCYFGLSGDAMTLEQIARQTGISRQAVHQSVQSALRRLRVSGVVRSMLS